MPMRLPMSTRLARLRNLKSGWFPRDWGSGDLLFR
jgi:hypothetical protein